jgi:hypothetical protein
MGVGTRRTPANAAFSVTPVEVASAEEGDGVVVVPGAFGAVVVIVVENL